MDTESVVLPSTTTSSLNLSLHPLPILNISEHLTRLRLQTRNSTPLVLGALLGTQNGRDVDIVNTFELAIVNGDGHDASMSSSDEDPKIDASFLQERRDQYKQVFPSLDLIGWYTVSPQPTPLHIAIHNQFTSYTPTPLLLVLSPTPAPITTGAADQQALPIKAYEPSIEIRDRKSRSVFVEVAFKVETGEAERIAVDFTARGGEGGTTLTSHLATQRAAIKMLHERIVALVGYVASVIAGTAPKDYPTLRALNALVASLPASENKHFREEFDTEFSDVQLTAFLSALTRSANTLNSIVDKHLILTAGADREPGGGAGGGGAGRGPRRRPTGAPAMWA
ncbi:hypothetical protein BOTBODRAFT_50728 [Botryobasidium botryosum FD-172 SS1]|uniref:COP9 signalosome complex subunit 6 n=1 Tax=Botryobasidium botryosum (strain FD-172 SS1) TaxID=930990 RepID=A0A067NA39_BOTB1|nr:hypothetical protein BOTBODRAFT_50728 [Botryobasidium botryosum FD-172 SS1]